MGRRDGSNLLLILGVVGLLLTSLASVYWGGSSAHNLQEKVDAAAKAAVRDAGHDWARTEAQGQKVIVRGLAPSERARSEAVTAAGRAIGGGGLLFGGVTRVADQVEVAPLVAPFSWKANVDDGEIVLSGYVPSRAAEAVILDAALTAYPNAEISNYMSLASGAPEMGDWTAAALIGLSQLSGLQPGAAELVDAELTVRGVATDSEAPDAIAEALSALSAPYVGRSYVTGLYGWAAELEDGELLLKGQAPDASAKRGLADTGRRFFEGDVVDRMTVGGGAEWTGTARLALPHFAKFVSGRMTVADRTLFIEGQATESVYDYLREDMDRRLSGIGVQYDVDAVAPVVEEIEGIDLAVDGAAKGEACQAAFVAVMATNQIYFATNEATITRRSGDTLDKLVTIARQCAELRLEVAGHTDDRGRRDYNIALSQRRAGAVAAYLVRKGLATEQISAVGYGPDRPATQNNTPEGRAANRRIEFTILEEGDL
ncbi:MAG: OmpA family protein [Pseudomonadota bacterium]